MKTSTKILAAFAVATIAGTVLGMLLISSEDSKSVNEIDESKKEDRSFGRGFFGGKGNKNFEEREKQNA